MRMNASKLVASAAAIVVAFDGGAGDLKAETDSGRPSGVAYGWRNVVIKGTGFTNGVVFSPAQRDLIYQYTDMGGAYRWDVDVQRWTPLNDWSRYNDWPAQFMGVEALAIHPRDPRRVYMVIGTYGSPAGMCRSDDAGRTWTRTDLLKPDGKPLVRANGNGEGRNGGNRLAIDSNDPQRLYFGSRSDGLWRSADGGATWARIESFPVTGDPRGPARDVGIIGVIVDPTSGRPGSASSTLYALVSTTAPVKVYRSADAGVTWTPVLRYDDAPAGSFVPIRAALTPDGQSLYVALANSPGPNGATDGAIVRIADPSGPAPRAETCDVPRDGSHGFSGVCIDPSNPQRILVSTLDRWAAIDDVFLSVDAGKTGRAARANDHRDDRPAPYMRQGKLHWIGDVQIDPFDSRRAILTTGSGNYITANLDALDRGEPPTWTFFNDGFEQTAVLELASPFRGDVQLFSAVGDRDGFRHDDFDVSPPRGQFGALDGLTRGTNDDVDVAQDDASRLVRLTHVDPFVQFSDDGGIHWKWIGTSRPERPSAERYGGSLALSSDGRRVVYSPGRTAGGEPLPVMYATRDGDQWSHWVTPINAPRGGRVLVDLGDRNTFYCSSGTAFWRSRDGASTWTRSSAELPSALRSVRAVPDRAGHLLAAGDENSGVYLSVDAGDTWTRLAPDAVRDAYAVGVGAQVAAANYPALYLAGSANGTTGFFRSDNRGATWISISDAAQQFGRVTVIQGDPRVPGRLYVGTNGRGILVGEPTTRPVAR